MTDYDSEELKARYRPGQLSEAQDYPGDPLAPQSAKEALYRLVRLARHLTGRRGHAQFCFAEITKFTHAGRAGIQEVGCGTMGCAVGELPFCWPEVFEFAPVLPNYDNMTVRAKESRSMNALDTATMWFGLDSVECGHLFIPGSQVPWLFGGRMMPHNSHVCSVIQNIWDFLEVRHGIDWQQESSAAGATMSLDLIDPCNKPT